MSIRIVESRYRWYVVLDGKIVSEHINREDAIKHIYNPSKLFF